MPKSSENTVRTILDAANRIVQEHGVERLTLEQTAREAGISKGGLLYHFPTKEALIKGMILYYMKRFTEDFNQAAQKEGEDVPGRWTRAYLHTTDEDYQRIPRMTSGLLAAIATDPALLAPMQQGFRDWVQPLEKDGIDPTTAVIIRLAIDGLWLVELFGLAPPDQAMRKKVLAVLDQMSTPQGAAGLKPGQEG